MSTEPTCCCPSSDAAECVRIRYRLSWDAAYEEPCTCACHGEFGHEPYDYDEEDYADDGACSDGTRCNDCDKTWCPYNQEAGDGRDSAPEVNP